MGTAPDHDVPTKPRYWPRPGVPQHQVDLPAFLIARYPVTVAEYTYALQAGAPSIEEPGNWSEQRGHPTHPVHGLLRCARLRGLAQPNELCSLANANGG